MATIEQIHDAGAKRHPLSWFGANTRAAEQISAHGFPMDERTKVLVSEIVLRVLDFVEGSAGEGAGK